MRSRGTSRLPGESLSALPIALVETLVGVASTFLLVVRGVILQAQVERVHPELARDRVHRALEPKGTLDVSRRAERCHGAGVRVHEHLGRAHVGARVELMIDLGRTCEPAA